MGWHNRTRTTLLLWVLWTATFAPVAFAQSPLLPPSLAPWERTEWRKADARQLETLAGAEAALLREYGSVRSEQGLYRHGRTQWQVTVHEMIDRSGAYGAFTLLGQGGQLFPVGDLGSRSATALIFYQGSHLVMADPGADVTALQALAEQLQAGGAENASLPTLPYYLPQRGLVRGSDCYLLGPLGLARVAPLAAGDWVGFAYAAEVEVARYRLGTDEATLLLISYPTPQIARARMEDFGRLFRLNGAGDPLRPVVYGRRTGTFVALLTGVGSAEAGAELLERVRYEMGVSWSDPSDPRAAISWAKTLVNIFIGTGLFLLFALLSGIAYGLLRLLVVRLAPGKVFDRPGSGDVITLNLTDHRR